MPEEAVCARRPLEVYAAFVYFHLVTEGVLSTVEALPGYNVEKLPMAL